MTWLVTGGAGFIGSHVVRALLGEGQRVAVLDDLSTGDKSRVPDGVPLEIGSVRDRAALDHALAAHEVTGVVHIAAKKQPGESVERPLWYYEQNVDSLRVLLEAMVAADVRRLVFSSSAAVYGAPDVPEITEDTPCTPLNPYGETKLVGEWMIRGAAAAYGLSYANLRYFNVAGAGAPELADPGVTNLVPMVFQRIEAGLPPLIFGDDYDTPDGTAIRDYIHVGDIAGAHVAAARRLGGDEPAALTLNIGRGEGVTVRQLIGRILEHTGSGLVPEITARRPGDGGRSVASAARIRAELGWSARYGIDEMVASAWAGWRLRHDA
jgi:UDP-glucose 4-epimerase